MFKFLIRRLLLILILAFFSFFILKEIQLVNNLNPEKEASVLLAIKRIGYNNPKLIDKTLVSNKVQFKCAQSINGVAVSQYYAEAIKNGKNRQIVLCLTNSQLAAYDGKEMPILPLWILKNTAISTYGNFQNTEALKQLFKYKERLDESRQQSLIHQK